MDLGWTSDIEKVHDDVSCKTLEVKEYVQSEKFMDESDVQVSDKDGFEFRSNTIKANSNDGGRANLDV